MHFFEFYMHSLLQLLRSFSSLTKCTYKQSNYKPSVKKQDFLAQINFVSFVSFRRPLFYLIRLDFIFRLDSFFAARLWKRCLFITFQFIFGGWWSCHPHSETTLKVLLRKQQIGINKIPIVSWNQIQKKNQKIINQTECFYLIARLLCAILMQSESKLQ